MICANLWGVVNQLAAILSASMMLEPLEQPVAAREVEEAGAAVLAEGRVRTPDLGGTNSTQAVTDAVLGKMA
jgi:tartrate dehydrogenase/decarboxylase/D-malate dehydrogenase